MCAKEQSPVEVYNDVDGDLVNFLRVLIHRELREELLDWLASTPYARQIWQDSKEFLSEGPPPPPPSSPMSPDVWRAYHFFVVAVQSFGGMFGRSWGSTVSLSRRGMAQVVSKWWGRVEGLRAISDRLLCVQVERSHIYSILERYDSEETCFYIDPPYAMESRNCSAELYKTEWSEADHEEFLQRVLQVKGSVLISHYEHDMYTRVLGGAGWEHLDYDAVCWAVAKTKRSGYQGAGKIKKNQTRKEIVWRNPRALKPT